MSDCDPNECGCDCHEDERDDEDEAEAPAPPPRPPEQFIVVELRRKEDAAIGYPLHVFATVAAAHRFLYGLWTPTYAWSSLCGFMVYHQEQGMTPNLIARIVVQPRDDFPNVWKPLPDSPKETTA